MVTKIDDHPLLPETEKNIDESLTISPTSHYHKKYKMSEKISIGIQTEEKSNQTEYDPSKF